MAEMVEMGGDGGDEGRVRIGGNNKGVIVMENYETNDCFLLFLLFVISFLMFYWVVSAGLGGLWLIVWRPSSLWGALSLCGLLKLVMTPN